MFRARLLLIISVSLVLFPQAARASEVFCFCADTIEGITADNFSKKDKELTASACQSVAQEQCTNESAVMAKDGGGRYAYCDRPYDTKDECVKNSLNPWNDLKKKTLKNADQSAQGLEAKSSSFIPDCALQNTLDQNSPCRDASIFVVLAIQVARYLFTIVGGIAIAMFIYGGFMLIISEGNPERLTKAKEILLAVIIGLAIAFGGYLLVTFLQESLGVSQEFRLLRL